MQTIAGLMKYLEEFNEVSIVVRLVLATIMGGIIGMDRGATKHAAGLRTFMLVCLGAALAQIINMRCVMVFGAGDPLRLAQGVISGIGFLGVGTIVVTRSSHIKGLTTAATLWTTAVLGISIGSGYIFSSLVAFLLIMFVIKMMVTLSRRQRQYNRFLQVKMELRDNEAIKKVMHYLRSRSYRITEMEKNVNGSCILIDMSIDLCKKTKHDHIIEELAQMDEVDFVTEIF